MSEPKKTQLQVKYESFQAVHSSQALVQSSQDEVILDFSSGVVADGQQGHVLPVHTRVAMSRAAAQRLVTAIQQALQNQPGNSGS